MTTTAPIQHVVILAAGMGRRLAPLTGGRPKALFTLNGRALFDYTCDFAEAVGSVERIVVGGFGFEALQEHIHSSGRQGLRLVRASDFRHGSVLSLVAALPAIHGSMLVMNVDHIYSTPLRATVAASHRAATVFCDKTRALTADDMKVTADARGHLREISKELTSGIGYIGLTYVPAGEIAAYRRAVARTLSRVGRSANVERVLQTWADEGAEIQICDVGALKWAEVDTPDDADQARRMSSLFA